MLRYFESREAVLLELLDDASREWLDAARRRRSPPRSTRRGAGRARATSWPPALAASLADRPVLCDLISAQAAVLERNVSPRGRRGVQARQHRERRDMLAELVRQHVPELGERDAMRFTARDHAERGGDVDPRAPAAAMIAAYEADPSLASWRLDFACSLCEISEVVITGLLARPSH